MTTYDVFTSATGTIGTYKTFSEAETAAKKLGITAYIFKTHNPFLPIKTVFAK